MKKLLAFCTLFWLFSYPGSLHALPFQVKIIDSHYHVWGAAEDNINCNLDEDGIPICESVVNA